MAKAFQDIGFALRALADLVEHTPDRDLQALSRGDAKLAIIRPEMASSGGATSKIGKVAKPSPTKLKSAVPFAKLDQIVADLKLADSTDIGMHILETAELTRREVEHVARKIDVQVRKDIKVDDLCRSIVNAMIGSRLNSAAIIGRSKAA